MQLTHGKGKMEEMKWYHSLIGIAFVLTVFATGAYILAAMLIGYLTNLVD